MMPLDRPEDFKDIRSAIRIEKVSQRKHGADGTEVDRRWLRKSKGFQFKFEFSPPTGDQ
jgi:hypothetical protein